MGHTPHLFLPQPWPLSEVPVPPASSHHVTRVLRLGTGAGVTYTDGAGQHGQGRLALEQRDQGRSIPPGGTVVRGDEHLVPPPAVAITMAVAPPHDRDRLRFMIEKLAELEVRRIAFLQTRFGVGRLPDLSKATAWAIGALEQSQGAWLPEIVPGWTDPASLDLANSWFADLDGADNPAPVPLELTIAIGPEGGWGPGEIPENATRFGLGRTVLRVETAAIVAAGLIRSRAADSAP